LGIQERFSDAFLLTKVSLIYIQKSGHAHPRGIVYEPEAPAALHQAHAAATRGRGGDAAARRAHDAARAVRGHAAGRVRPQCRHPGCPRGKNATRSSSRLRVRFTSCCGGILSSYIFCWIVSVFLRLHCVLPSFLLPGFKQIKSLGLICLKPLSAIQTMRYQSFIDNDIYGTF
jgi:hypothetical protein